MLASNEIYVPNAMTTLLSAAVIKKPMISFWLKGFAERMGCEIHILCAWGMCERCDWFFILVEFCYSMFYALCVLFVGHYVSIVRWICDK